MTLYQLKLNDELIDSVECNSLVGAREYFIKSYPFDEYATLKYVISWDGGETPAPRRLYSNLRPMNKIYGVGGVA